MLNVCIYMHTLLHFTMLLTSRTCAVRVHVVVCVSCICQVDLSVCPHVFSQTVAVVDTKHGYVGWYNGRSAQQESRVVLSKNSMFLGC